MDTDREDKNIAGSESENPRQNSENGNPTDAPQPGSIKIEIVKWQPFINAISDSRSIARTAGLLALVVCLIFSGLLLLVITLKRMYPYSDIQTNMYGATTIRDEEKDVMYWLFNTAELWANSGINVKKGDVLNIRASGMSNTAIHKLVKDATENRLLTSKWISTDGTDVKENPRDMLRSRWRIVPKRPQDALVMRVVEDGSDNDYRYGDPGIYLIGKGREGIQIHEDGFLQFAINDIVLTKEVIYKMLRDHGRELVENFEPTYLPVFNKYPLEYTEDAYEQLMKDSTLARLYAKYNKSPENEESYEFGPYPAENGEGPINEWGKNEMTYYMKNGYKNAWYDDNIGSFLIVIERKH